MYDVEYTSTGWAKDGVLVDEIMKCMNSTYGKDFIFAVSVQGHGRYPEDELGCEEHVKVTREDGDEVLQNQFGYYVNQTYEMDEMIGELVEELDASGENYVLVLYGDHIPSLNFEDGQISQGTEFQTEYVIVNNIGLTLEDQDLYSFDGSGSFQGLYAENTFHLL
jgi:phosphoglycerol transferase MdoB-like AlkP superfamily enzyme